MPCYRIFDGVVCDVKTSADTFEFSKSASAFADMSDETSNLDSIFLATDDLQSEDSSGVYLEVQINGIWSGNEATDESRYDEFATYSNATLYPSNDSQGDWLLAI